MYDKEVLKSNLCDYNAHYILVKADVTITGRNFATNVLFKNCAPFINCITKTDKTIIEDAEEWDLFMQCIIC